MAPDVLMCCGEPVEAPEAPRLSVVEPVMPRADLILAAMEYGTAFPPLASGLQLGRSNEGWSAAPHEEGFVEKQYWGSRER